MAVRTTTPAAGAFATIYTSPRDKIGFIQQIYANNRGVGNSDIQMQNQGTDIDGNAVADALPRLRAAVGTAVLFDFTGWKNADGLPPGLEVWENLQANPDIALQDITLVVVEWPEAPVLIDD